MFNTVKQWCNKPLDCSTSGAKASIAGMGISMGGGFLSAVLESDLGMYVSLGLLVLTTASACINATCSPKSAVVFAGASAGREGYQLMGPQGIVDGDITRGGLIPAPSSV